MMTRRGCLRRNIRAKLATITGYGWSRRELVRSGCLRWRYDRDQYYCPGCCDDSGNGGGQRAAQYRSRRERNSGRRHYTRGDNRDGRDNPRCCDRDPRCDIIRCDRDTRWYGDGWHGDAHRLANG